MKDYCFDCSYRDECDLVDQINFCEDCKYYPSCSIRYASCEGGFAVECNNGFESQGDWDDGDEE